MNNLAIQVSNLSKRYRLQHNRQFLSLLLSKITKKIASLSETDESIFYALDNVSFEIQKGESWGIIGVNGSGKSTLLKIISGNLRPSNGSVKVDGKVAILDYSAGFHDEFTGKENIFLKASLLGLTRKKTQQHYDSIVQFAAIGEFIDQPVKNYSSGMRARLGFAIMAHVNADILITDEALAVGDIFFVQKCMRFIRTFLKQGTFLFVSHSMEDILALCSHAIWLEKGKIKAIGLAPAVTRAYMDEQTLKMADELVPLEEKSSHLPHMNKTGENIKTDIKIEQSLLSQLMNYSLSSFHLVNNKYQKMTNEIHVICPKQLQSGINLEGAKILRAALYNEDDELLSCVFGGMSVRLCIDVFAERELLSPIVGFQIINQYGQVLLADNSHVMGSEQLIVIPAKTQFVAEFTFQLPLFPLGDYSLRAAIAVGEVEASAILLQTIDQALILRVVASLVKQGLMGLPDCHMHISHSMPNKQH